MHQLPGFAPLMAIDRIKWTRQIINGVIDDLDNIESESYRLKSELRVVLRTLRGAFQMSVYDYEQD